MSNPKQENFQAFPSGIPVQPLLDNNININNINKYCHDMINNMIPKQYDQPQVGQPSVQAHHLPAAPVVVQEVTNTVEYDRDPVRTICPHCENQVGKTT